MNNSVDFELIGKRVKEKRQQLHITQQTMADELSISKYYISKIEHGKVKVTLETLAEIANFLKSNIFELLEDSSPLDKNYYVSDYIDIYNKATPKQKTMILQIAKIIINEE